MNTTYLTLDVSVEVAKTNALARGDLVEALTQRGQNTANGRSGHYPIQNRPLGLKPANTQRLGELGRVSIPRQSRGL